MFLAQVVENAGNKQAAEHGERDVGDHFIPDGSFLNRLGAATAATRKARLNGFSTFPASSQEALLRSSNAKRDGK